MFLCMYCDGHWTFRSHDHSLPGAKVPDVELSLPGTPPAAHMYWKHVCLQDPLIHQWLSPAVILRYALLETARGNC